MSKERSVDCCAAVNASILKQQAIDRKAIKELRGSFFCETLPISTGVVDSAAEVIARVKARFTQHNRTLDQ